MTKAGRCYSCCQPDPDIQVVMEEEGGGRTMVTTHYGTCTHQAVDKVVGSAIVTEVQYLKENYRDT